MIKKIINLFTIFILIFNSINFVNATEEINIDDEFHSQAVVLMEFNSGNVLYEKNMNERLYPASVTKILTAILAIENCDLSETVIASDYSVNSITSGYTTAGIKVGEEFSLEQVLEVMMLHSANEAATMIAEHVAGSVGKFSKLMNKKAREIGCLDTHFVNANGMHDENHYSTAYDMALIQRYCMQNEEYRRISKMVDCTLPQTQFYDGEPRYFKNTHAFLLEGNKNYYPYAISGKTGYTTPAKNCLITSSNKDGLELIAVVLHAEGTIDGISARYLDTRTLFDYGYDNYRISNFLEKDSVVDTIKIRLQNGETEDLDLVLEEDLNIVCKNSQNIKKNDGELELNDISFPIKKNQVLGTYSYWIDNQKYTSNVVAQRDVEQSGSIIENIEESSKTIVNIAIIIILSTLIFIILILIIIYLFVFRAERKRVNQI